MYEDFIPVYPGKSQPSFAAGVAAGGQETDCEIDWLYFTITSRRGETRQVLYSIESKQILGLDHASSSVPPPPPFALCPLLLYLLLSASSSFTPALTKRHTNFKEEDGLGKLWEHKEGSVLQWLKETAKQGWLRAPVSLEQPVLLFQGALTTTASKAMAHQFLLSAQVRLPVDWPGFLIYFLFPLAEQRKP